MEKEQIKKIVRDATDKHLYVVNRNTVEELEKTLIENLNKALNTSDVSVLLFDFYVYVRNGSVDTPKKEIKEGIQGFLSNYKR